MLATQGGKQINADKILEHGADVYRKRQAEYGDSYNAVGWVLEAMFPDGIHLNGNIDMTRFSILVQQVTKLCRYTQKWDKPHGDSMFDNAVYAAIMNEIDCYDPVGGPELAQDTLDKMASKPINTGTPFTDPEIPGRDPDVMYTRIGEDL